MLCKLVKTLIRAGLALFVLSFGQQLQAKPLVQNGLLDLSEWDFARDGSIELNGTWQFYWNQHLDPDLIRLEQL